LYSRLTASLAGCFNPAIEELRSFRSYYLCHRVFLKKPACQTVS
jgi:hypothetical protein